MNAPVVPRHAADFASLYAEHFAFVWRVLRRFGVDESELEDRAQDVFVVAHRRWDEFERRSADRTWLYGIARRVASDHRRSRDRTRRRHQALAQAELTQGSARRDASEAIIFLDGFLAGLDEDLREAFVLFELEGLRAAEIEELTGVKSNTLYSRRRKAKLAFEKLLGSDQVTTRHLRRVGRAHEPDAGAERRVANLLPFLGAAYFELAATEAAGVGSAAPVVAGSTGIKLALAAGVVAALGAVGWMATQDPPPAPSAASEELHADASEPMKRAPTGSPPAPEEPSVQAPAAPPAPAPALAPIPQKAPKVRPQSPAQPQPMPEADGDLAAQANAHEQARNALRQGNPRAALEHGASYLRRWPEGPFARSSQLLRIEALCELGETARARAELGRLRVAGIDAGTKRALQQLCVGDGSAPSTEN